MSEEPCKETLLLVRAKEIEFLNTKFAETKTSVTESQILQNVVFYQQLFSGTLKKWQLDWGRFINISSKAVSKMFKSKLKIIHRPKWTSENQKLNKFDIIFISELVYWKHMIQYSFLSAAFTSCKLKASVFCFEVTILRLLRDWNSNDYNWVYSGE